MVALALLLFFFAGIGIIHLKGAAGVREKVKKLAAFFRDWDNQSKYLGWMIEKTKPFLPSLTLLFVLNVLLSLTGIGSTVVTKYIIDGVTGGGSNFTRYGMLLMILLTVASIGISAYSGVKSTYINERYAFGIRSKVFDNILHGVWGKITSFHSGDIVTRLTSDINSVASGIASILPTTLFLAIRLVIAFFVLFYYDHFLAVAALLLGPIGALFSLIFSSKLKQYQVEMNKTESEYRSFLQETVENIAVEKAFKQEAFCNEKLAFLRNKRLAIIKKRNRLTVAMNVSIRSIFYAGYITAFAWSIYRLSNHSITYGTMTIFLSLVSQVQGPIMDLGNMIPQFISVLASAGRVMEMDGIENERRGERIISGYSQDIGIKIQNVSFGYGVDSVLDGISYNINPRDIVGVVGESGAGKTTLACLVLSLIQADSGRICFYDEAGAEEEASATARRFISYVPQGNTLISGTIAENLRTGNPDATDAELWEALEIADCVSFVSQLEAGLSTPIGENGTGLSVGQAQRIAIARAIIKKAPILVLDEATSALDANTEERVIKRMSDSDMIRTCLIITHRRSMLAYCNRAIEIENKQLQELELFKDSLYV